MVLTALGTLQACASSGPLKPAELAAITRDVERKAFLVRQFRADFVKTSSVSLFKKDLSVKGRLVFQKPERFLLTLRGDVNVEVLSDGRFIKMIHDQKDEEIHRVRGDRDWSRFADPLMLLVKSVGNGGLRILAIVKTVRQGDLLMVEIDPRNETHLERVKRVFLWLSDFGDIRKIRIVFYNGNVDETVFTSWAFLDEDGPEIHKLHERLKTITQKSQRGAPEDRTRIDGPLARNDPFPEPFLLREPVSADDSGHPAGGATVTLP